MAALIVDEQGAVAVRGAVDRLRSDFRVPSGRIMSWKEDLKNHDRRKRAAEILAAIDGLKVCYVYAQKDALRADSYVRDRMRFYNYVAMKMYTSVLWAARNWKGTRARLWTRFGHVRGHDHMPTRRYLTAQAASDQRVPHQLEQGLRWVGADQYVESQAADIFAGFLKAALWPTGEFDYVEPSYLLTVWHLIRNSETCVVPLGLMSMPENSLVAQQPWFPCAGCPSK